MYNTANIPTFAPTKTDGVEIKELPKLYLRTPQVQALLSALSSNAARVLCLYGLCGSARNIVISAVVARTKSTILIIEDTADDAAYTYEDLCALAPAAPTFLFPISFRRALRYGQKDQPSEVLRTELLTTLHAREREPATPNEGLIIVTYPEALTEKVIDEKTINESKITVSVGQTYDITALEERLIAAGFCATDYVYEPGQIARRGSILDIFSYGATLPYRLDFLSDTIDSIRSFELDTQLSREKVSSATLLPPAASTTARTLLTTYLPAATVVVTKGIERVCEQARKIYQTGFLPQALAADSSTTHEGQDLEQEITSLRERLLATPASIVKALQQYRTLTLSNDTGAARQSTNGEETIITFSTTPQPLVHSNCELLRATITHYQNNGYTTYILAENDKQRQRLHDILAADDDSATAASAMPAALAHTLVRGTLHEGFIDNAAKHCFFSDHQIFDRYHKYHVKTDHVRAGKAALTLKELQEVAVGDYLVHIDFGIARFAGLVKKITPNGYNEAIRLVYARGDIVDVSIHSLYKLAKYRRAGETPPRLSILGSGAWERMKANTKRHIKEVARDLITLYAQRLRQKGFAYSPDSYLQHELEASFIYEDTPDQLLATQDVKADMEAPRPMDRLICGDVGFGKTEIAIRAAFKACADSKQVAILVPTTVLAFQHYQTFTARLKDFPVRVEYLSRARSPRQAKAIMADLSRGAIDIIIGTHRLLAVKEWHDLGLLIIDEEQKFGVKAKEQLRQIKANVDTLALTATPIPRTLQFSLLGARDMNVMRTPPPNRYPIATTIATSDRALVREAINFEMSRNGQVFVVTPRVAQLDEIARMIYHEVPDCRLAIAHGRMNSEELESTLLGFINYDYDVLLSTTIVENGVDIPNANTIIIYNAHHFGLADLHQMRGRVGRSNRKAFCYLLTPPLEALNDDARRRLEALETFSDLGAGFALSMQDLDIRGAGSLLGTQQSGFMEEMGYETYQKILTQAITELKDEEFQDLYREEMKRGAELRGDAFVDDCTIESDLQMYFPDDYVPTESERLRLYRELDNIQTDAELRAYRQRLTDRFGPVPPQGEELMLVVLLRRYGRKAGCQRITIKNGTMSMQFVSNPQSAFFQSKTFSNVIEYITSHAQQCQLKEINGRRLLRVNDVNTIKQALTILRTIIQRSAL